MNFLSFFSGFATGSSTHLYALFALVYMKIHGLTFKPMYPQTPALSGFMELNRDMWIYETWLACNDTKLHIRFISLFRQFFCRVIVFDVFSLV